ncbi:unnamed protein product [Sphagnum jensenii]|uniref:CWF19-like protein 2 n=1 Tax=Sphagnum jensenii TaxID=128206 RepID=A0ABP1AMS6_9BRYO
MLGALRFIPRDSVPAVVSQNHSEADEKRGSNYKDDAAKRKHSARKERKFEHRVKRKKHRKSRKDEESSEGSSDDDDDDDDGSEEHQANQEVRRKEAGLEWMTQAPERPAPVVVESEDVHTLEGEKPQSSVKELNPYWKSAGNGLPSEGDTGGLQKGGRSGLPPPPGVGDGGASWRLKALKRAQEQAAREGRQLDEVVEERWGSLAALTTSVAVQRAAHANSHMHAKRDRRRTSQGHDVSGVGKADAPAEPEDEDDRRIRTSSRDYLCEVKAEGSRMKAPQADRSLSWKSKGRGGKPGMRPEDAAVFRAAAVTYNKFNDDGTFFKGLNLKSAQEEKVDLGAQISAVDETPRIVESGAVLKRESEEAPVTEHLTRISRIEVESDKRTESSGVQLQGLSTNQMAAKVMRLRLQGKHKEAEELLKQSESAAKRENEVFADAPAEEPTSRPSGVLARLEVLGQKTILSRRKTADRDLAETISRNKLYKADDEYDDYGPAAGKKQKKSAGTRETVATQGRNRIVTQHERCQWCFDNGERPKHLTIALANFTYLTLSPRRPIVPSHCFIVPMQHEGATRNVDEAVWEELRNFKKCLVRMFSEQEKEVIFLETAMHLSRMRHHCVVECIPIPASFAKEAPLYFKKAIEEAESEWSQHNSKKLIDTTGKGLRACIPKNFPYFHVEFGLNAGYVHVIDDEASFKPQFGADVIRGMLETEGIEMHGQSASLKQQQQAVRDFTKMWEPHDWTKMLD